MVNDWRVERLENELQRLRSDVDDKVSTASLGNAIKLCNTRIAVAAVLTCEAVVFAELVLLALTAK